MSHIIRTDKGYLHISSFRKEFYRSTSAKADINFSTTHCHIKAGEVDHQGFDNDLADLRNADFKEVPNPGKLVIRLDYFKESGKWYSEGFVAIDKPEDGPVAEAESWYEFLQHVRELMAKRELPGLVKGSQFEVMVTGSEHPGGYPQIFRLEK